KSGRPVPAKTLVSPGEAGAGVLLSHVAACQLVRIGDSDDFLNARYFFERARFDLASITSNASSSPFRAWNGVGAISEGFDFVANSANVLRRGVRLHDYQHGFSLELKFSLQR